MKILKKLWKVYKRWSTQPGGGQATGYWDNHY